MNTIFPLCAAALLAVLAGCATSSNRVAKAGTEECHVCRYNNDLACVCVKVDATTPRAVYLGTTNYFCSEECRSAFLKKPEKYLPK